MVRVVGACAAVSMLLSIAAQAQVIQFDSNGLHYQTLTRSGVTIMFAHLPAHLHEYSIIQVEISNGSAGPYVIRPEDFSIEYPDGAVVHGTPAHDIIEMLMQKGSGSDVVKLVTTYEAGLYGNPHFKSTNGYEARRQGALAVSSTRLRAAATASALALVRTRLEQGESTDGAVFFAESKPLTGGKLIVRTNTDVFQFTAD
ncbi:MAG TPA: hypothetical protein VGE89_00440 [Bryobacteraceae bacterium]|jgi:hypothetical protein